VQTPRRCGQEFRAADLLVRGFELLPFLTNCEIVGIILFVFFPVRFVVTRQIGAAKIDTNPNKTTIEVLFSHGGVKLSCKTREKACVK
jgi:hypothetical protein